MIFVYLLASLWVAGCFFIPLYYGIKLIMEDETEFGVAMILIGWPMGCLLGILPWLMIWDIQSPDLVTLKKGVWTCTKSHQVTTTTLIKAGNSFVPRTSTRSVCDQYNRISYRVE